MFDSLINWLADKLSDVLQWLFDLVLWLPKKLFSLIMDALATFFEALPVPEFVTQAAAYFQGIPSGFLFFLNYFAVGEGMAMVLGAYVLRFVIRRIPFIG